MVQTKCSPFRKRYLNQAMSEMFGVNEIFQRLSNLFLHSLSTSYTLNQNYNFENVTARDQLRPDIQNGVFRSLIFCPTII